MDLLQHCAIAPVLYNKPSLSLTPLAFLIFFFFIFLSLPLFPRVTMCLTPSLIHCDLRFVKTSYTSAALSSRVRCFSDKCDLDRVGSDSSHKTVKHLCSHPHVEYVRSLKSPYVSQGCELVRWCGGLHAAAHVPTLVSYHKPSCQSLSIGHHL